MSPDNKDFLDRLERLAQRCGVDTMELGRAMVEALEQGNALYPDNERQAFSHGVKLLGEKYPSIRKDSIS